MKKRTLTLFLILALVCALLPTAAFASGEDFIIYPVDDFIIYPVEGGNIYFEPVGGKVADADSTITVANIPAEINGVAVTSIWGAFSHCTSLTSIVIPDSVTDIGDYAFLGCANLTSIVIPDSVTNIGDYAFRECANLTSIVIPDSVTSIGEETFADCDSLTSITIPSSVTNIGNYAFSHCTSLTSIVIPDSVTNIGNYAFWECASLTSIVIPDSVTSIGDGAFSDCANLTSIVIPDSVTSIGDHAFSGCANLTSIVIPDSVTSIGDRAFSGCANLTSIVIPDSVTSIESETFAFCSSLASIVIPDSVTNIGPGAFEGTILTSINLPDGVTSIGKDAFAFSCLTNIVIPDSVTSIESGTFAVCDSLASIVIPDSVTSIGECAFEDCISLTSVTIKNPNCGIYAGYPTLGVAGTTVIHGYTNSTAQTYAEEYGYEFIPLDGKPEPTDPKPTEPTPTDPKPSNPTPSTPTVTNPFADLKATAYYYQPVQWAYANNITAGTSATTFSPEQGCTRAQVVSFLWRAAGSPKPTSSSNPFTDIKAGSYYYDAVLWAAEKGITAGTSATTFSPNARVTRSQFVTFLYRFAGSTDVGGVKNPFNDLNTKAFYCNAVLWAVENGITAGTSATTFSPEATCTRGQVVSFLYRYFN